MKINSIFMKDFEFLQTFNKGKQLLKNLTIFNNLKLKKS